MILHDFTVTKQPAVSTFQLTAHQQVLLLPIGDVHAYAEGWPAARFADHVKWGVDRGAWFLGMGEYLDFTSTSQRLVLRGLRDSQRQTLDEMLGERVEKLAKLIAGSRGRWLGMLEGHHFHEYRDGTTTDQHLCRLLDAPFLGTCTLLELRLVAAARGENSSTVTVFAHHGCGGTGRRQGGGLLRLEDLLTWIEADIYLMGHNHSKVNAPVDRLYRTREGHLYHRTKLLARTGGWLRAYIAGGPQPLTAPAAKSRGSYLEQGALAPSAIGGLVISIGLKRERTGGTDFSIPDIHYSV